ncbi:DUF1788 domain-containing protein [Atopococcus tabaci]|uniref:DUF1788 domain-containing protein n=1 Tax=Atopococcus tabaci TaxID=269774 RepID=UPI00041E860A|nr:DUF1788 domain-containing protein [Atopococcus tabaci]
MRNIADRLEELQDKLLDEKLLQNKGLGNEVGFYIFDYDPKEELVVREAIPRIKRYIEKENPETRIQIFDLYDIVLEFFEQKGFMNKNFEMEEKKGSEELFEIMKKTLRIATNQDRIIRYIEEKWDGESMVFLTGVGKAFPIVRSHTVLNNLQTIVEDKPLILFYPGQYEHGSLKLFSKFTDDNYYRAFKITEN